MQNWDWIDSAKLEIKECLLWWFKILHGSNGSKEWLFSLKQNLYLDLGFKFSISNCDIEFLINTTVENFGQTLIQVFHSI